MGLLKERGKVFSGMDQRREDGKEEGTVYQRLLEQKLTL